MADKFNFNLKETVIYQAVRWAKNPVFKLAKPLRKLFFLLFVFAFLFFLYGFLTDAVSSSIQSLLLGLSIILLVLFLACRLMEFFLDSKIKKPKLNVAIKEVIANLEKFNLADFLEFESALAVSAAVKYAKKKKFPEISSTLLFYFLIAGHSGNLNFIFSRVLLNVKEIKKFLEKYFQTINSQIRPVKMTYSEDFQETILESLKTAVKKGHSRIETTDIIAGLAKHDLVFKRILIDNNLKFQDIENLAWWLDDLMKREEERKKFWQKKNLMKRGSLGKEWTAGYTVTLDRFSIDLSQSVRENGFPEIIGHEREISAMERVLSGQDKNNVLIVGESGSGRKSMVYALAEKSALGESLTGVNYKRVVQLDLAGLLAQISSPEEVEAVLDDIFKEALSAGNVILVIDEFHNFIGSRSRPGVIDVSGVLSPYLAQADFQIVAVTTFEGLHKNIEQNSSVLSLFEKVEVAEISERETLMLLENLSLILEQKYKKFVSYPALRDIIFYCSKYLPAIPFPEKAMDLLDEAMVYLAQGKDKILLPKHIAYLVSEKTQIPVGEMEKGERQILLNLENLIHERIVNQEEAVKEISTALRRARADVTIRKGPMGSFLFLGPTGVGKTETSKALAEIYFGSEERMIRLDMSEFQNTADIPRLLGSPGEEGLLTTAVRKRPFSLILLDEIEKAHPNVLNLFLQVLDEGHLTDGLGRKVDFKNSIIISTSNAGYQVILQVLKEKTEWSKVKEMLLERLFQEGVFRPEFINRFDAMVVFKPLTRENLLAIVDLMFEKLRKNLKEKEIDFIVSQPLKEKIAELGYDPTFGARQMRRVIQDKVENVLASALLSGEIKRGSRIEMEPENFKIIKK